jgi:hypothetical protein
VLNWFTSVQCDAIATHFHRNYSFSDIYNVLTEIENIIFQNYVQVQKYETSCQPNYENLFYSNTLHIGVIFVPLNILTEKKEINNITEINSIINRSSC